MKAISISIEKKNKGSQCKGQGQKMDKHHLKGLDLGNIQTTHESIKWFRLKMVPTHNLFQFVTITGLVYIYMSIFSGKTDKKYKCPIFKAISVKFPSC